MQKFLRLRQDERLGLETWRHGGRLGGRLGGQGRQGRQGRVGGVGEPARSCWFPTKSDWRGVWEVGGDKPDKPDKGEIIYFLFPVHC